MPTISPAGATITISGGTPLIPVVVRPTGATITISTAAPLITRPVTAAPAGATVPVTGGTANVLRPAAGVVMPLSVFVIITGATATVTAVAPLTIGPAAAPVTITGGTATVILGFTVGPPVDLGGPLATQCSQTWQICQNLRAAEQRLRKTPPLVRIWDAEWNLQFLGGTEYKGSFSWISNDTGPGQMEFPVTSPVSAWIQDDNGRIARGQGRNVCITVDYCGARWSGLLDKFAVEQREDGDMVLVTDWLHDYEHLKWYSVWSRSVDFQPIPAGRVPVPARIVDRRPHRLGPENVPVAANLPRTQPHHHLARRPTSPQLMVHRPRHDAMAHGRQTEVIFGLYGFRCHLVDPDLAVGQLA
jgi:hypothetical protein